MFTTLESYSVVDSIASRLRVTVSPRIISRNLDLRDIETLPLNLDLYHLNPRWTTSRVSTFGFSSFKNPILDESARFSIEPPIFQLQFLFKRNIFRKHRALSSIHFPNRVFIYNFNNLGLFPWHLVIRNFYIQTIRISQNERGYFRVYFHVKFNNYNFQHSVKFNSTLKS